MSDFARWDELKQHIKSRVNLADLVREDGVLDLKGGPNEFKARCPFHQEKTPSFTVFHKEGAWAFHCFGCEAQGDVFEWVMRKRGLEFPEALRWLANREQIAVPEPRVYQPPNKKTAAHFDASKYRALTGGSKVFRYLTEQRRLDAGLLVDYGVGETADGEAYAFGYKWRPPGWPAERAPKAEFAKVVKVDRVDGKKVEWRDPAGRKNILFGMESALVRGAHEAAGELVICEGEIDAISWAQYGWPAVSVPGGAKYTGWMDLCWDWLQRFRKIHISFDEDNAGRLKLVEIVTRLGMARADIIRLPAKEVAP